VPLFRQVNRRRWQQAIAVVTQTFAQRPIQLTLQMRTPPTISGIALWYCRIRVYISISCTHKRRSHCNVSIL